MDPWPAWAILYLACAIVYVVYLLVNFYYKNKLPPKQSNLNKSSISLSSSQSYKDLNTLHDKKNSSISNRLNQINKSISILEEKIMKSGKSHLLTPKRDDTCTTGLDYLRKGLRNRKKQIPKDPKDIIFEQKDRERKAKRMAQNLEVIKQDTLSLQDDISSLHEKSSTIPEHEELTSPNNEKTSSNHLLKPNTKKTSSKKATLEANSSFGSNSTTSTSLHGSMYSSTRTLPITETTSVDSYKETYEEKTNLQDLQRIMREVQDLKTLTSTYKGLQAKRS